MATQLEVFKERLKRISGWTSDKEVSAESYYNDVTILLDILSNIRDYCADGCPWCEFDGAHKDGCLLAPLFAPYKGYTHTLARRDSKKGAWEEPDRAMPDRDNPVPVEKSPGFSGYVGPARRHGPSVTAHRSSPAGPPPFKIWKDNGLGLMEIVGPASIVASVKERYIRGGWSILGENTDSKGHVNLSMLIEEEKVDAFIAEVKAEQKEAQLRLQSTGTGSL